MPDTLNNKRSLGLYGVLFISYFLVGHFLSSISFQSQIIPIWLPAGIALVGCFIWWWRFLPAVFIASMAFNYSVHPFADIANLFGAPGAELLVIASGATLQALVGSALLRYWIGNPLTQSSNIKLFYFIFVVGILVNLISANIGIVALSTFNPNYSQDNYWLNVVYWWLGGGADCSKNNSADGPNRRYGAIYQNRKRDSTRKCAFYTPICSISSKTNFSPSAII